MDIERLKELKDYLRVANELSILNDHNLMQRIVDNNDVTNTIDIAIELLEAEIARQSVTSEEVQRAIKTVEGIAICASDKQQRTDARLAITALQAYQPWIPVSERLPENCESYLVVVREEDQPNDMIHVDVASSYGKYIDDFWDTFNDWKEGQEVHITHWKPLPEPPKGE